MTNFFLWRSTRRVLALSIILWVGSAAQGEILPRERVAPWQGVGVAGGIPNSANMTVFTTVPAGASAATINTAIQNCPSNQVVQLAAGVYNLTGRLNGKSGVVLRGAGMTNTILVPQHGNYGGCIYVGGSYVYQAISSSNYNGGGTANWTAGHAQGSSNLTFSSTTGLTVGNVVILDQLNDPFIVNTVGFEGNNQAGRGKGARALQQYSRVTAINGNTVTIWPPVAAPIWNASFSPQAFWMGSGGWTRKFGIEDLSIDGTGLSGGDPYRANIYFETAQDCWIKNVKSIKPTVSHVSFYGAINCEVRRSIFYDTKSAASMSYGIVPLFCSWLLIEDNVFDKVVGPVVLGASAGCGVIGYNYTTNMYYTQANNFLMASFQPHAAHNYMWLMEGNYIGSKVTGDFIHGTTSHNVLFRNRVTGYAPSTYPSGPSANNMHCIWLDISNRVWSSVGNILGTAGIYNNYQSVPGARAGGAVIYSLGIENTAYGKNWGDDAQTYATYYRHMDYDTVTGGIRYNPTNADVSLPDSLYHTSKPAFFGSMPWPPYNPLNVKPSDVSTSTASYTNIPAGYRYAYGRDPTTGPVNQSPIANASATPTNGAAPLAVSFSSAGSFDPEAATLTYSWVFGDGGSSTAANPSHNYTNAGTYNAQLSVSDGTNTASSAVIVVRAFVPGPPVAVANATPTSGFAPLTIAFSSAGSYDPEGAPLTYNWTFGDGTTSTAANPSHTYTSAGNFNARLQVSAGADTTLSSLLTITVTNPPPGVSLTSPTSGASYSAPATINLAASVTPNGHTITKVQFYNGTTLLGEDSTVPYTLSWTNVGVGGYSLTGRVVYGAGAMTDSLAVTVNVGGLVAAYGFEEGSGGTTADASGNGNSGTINGAVWRADGRFGNALQFNGTNALVSVSPSASLNLSAGVTLAAWVYPTTLGGWRAVVYRHDNVLALEGSTSQNQVPSFGGSFSPSPMFAPSALPLNAWSYLVGTFDGTTARLFVNGTQVASRSETGNLLSSPHPISIGGDLLSGQYFAGLIDEVRIYNRALSATEIQADMTVSISQSPPTTPKNLAAVALSASSLNLTWGASSNAAGVVGYHVERSQGSGSTNFVQIASPTGTNFNDTGLVAATVYNYRVRAVDGTGGLSAYSGVASATTGGSAVNQPPTVTLTTPLTGASAYAPSAVTLNANASDSDGSVTKVEFFEGLNKVGEDTSAPYSVTLNASAARGYVLTAVAHDNSGAAVLSASVVFTAVQPGISSAQRLPNGSFNIVAAGTAGRTNTVHVSSDLATWTLLTNLVNVAGTVNLVDAEAAILSRRYYRIWAESLFLSNVVGFARVSVPPGYSIIANQFIQPTNTVAAVLTGVPGGTSLSKFRPATGDFAINNYDPIFLSWLDPNQSFTNGDTGFLLNPTTNAFTVTFQGRVPQGLLSFGLPAGYSMVGSLVPQPGTIQTQLGFPGASGDTVFLYRDGRYRTSQYDPLLGGWDLEPNVNVGEGFFLFKTAATNWVRSFSAFN